MTITISNPKKEAVTKLSARMQEALETLPLAVVRNALEHFDQQKFAEAVAQLNPIKVLSIQERNAVALAKSRERVFGLIKQRYSLFDAKTVCELLGITKQALSKKGSSGKVMAYSFKGRKYYPSFQFLGDQVDPAVGKLIEETGFDPTEPGRINVVLGYLMHDTIAVGTDQPHPRYTLISSEDERAIMVEDLTRPLEMGQ